MSTIDTEPYTDVKTFRAATMSEALQLVKKSLGPDAVILHTKQISGKRALPWQSTPDEVEIMAGLGIPVRSHAATRKYAETLEAASTPPVDAPTNSPLPIPNSRIDAAHLGPMNVPQGESIPSVAELARRIDAIHSMLEQLGLDKTEQPSPSQSTPAPKTSPIPKYDPAKLPASLQDIRTQLTDVEVPETLIENILDRMQQECTAAQLEDPSATKALLTAIVEQNIQTSGPIRVERGKRKVVALVGATGVGKTTTIAKLAANFRLRDQVRMGLVTVDTYRIAAVEQLRTYAEIIDLPMKVVTNPLEMRRALDDLVGLDLVLIDTAGRSPRDELQIQELKRLLVEAQVDEVHLVMSLTSSLRSLLAAAEKFSLADATSVIFTKLDEAAGLGNLLALCEQVPLPISYLTTGQDVPNDIEPAQADRIARLILKTDNIVS